MLRRTCLLSRYFLITALTLLAFSRAGLAQSTIAPSVDDPSISSASPLLPMVGQVEEFAVSQPVQELSPPLPLSAEDTFSSYEVLQDSSPPVNYNLGLNFLGIGNGFSNYTVSAEPPDTNIAVGRNQIVQWVHSTFAVFAKNNGHALTGAIPFAMLFAHAGGRCASIDNGDAIVQYDARDDRWVLVQNALVAPYAVCIAVSQGPDATGSYFLYQYSMSGLPDYQKFAIWPTGWFQAMNNFGPHGNSFQGALVCAYNSAKLLEGDHSAEQICFQLSNQDNSLLPADLDSLAQPPQGQDEFLIGSVGAVDNSHLSLYSFHVNFVITDHSRITGNGNSQLISIASFTPACGGHYNGNCVPQQGVSNLLQSLGDRLMYRFAYYNDDATLASIPVMQLAVFQQGTLAPDNTWRWMGSAAGDHANDILLGYSIANTNLHPGLAVAGRTASDPSGTMEDEVRVVVGAGSQSSSPWGGYSAMRVDPADNCTFWYTTEYYRTIATINWSTRIASVTFPHCPDPRTARQHWYVSFDVGAQDRQNGIRWMELVNGLPSQTTVTSSPNPSTYLQSVTITATVTGQGATGTVDFTDTFNNVVTPLCMGVHLSGGVARCMVSSLLAGTHSHIVAAYSGDRHFAGSSGIATPAQVVHKAASRTTVTSSPNPSTYLQQVTIKATVTGQGATGTVDFTDTFNHLVTHLCMGVHLSGGVARCTVSTLLAGTHDDIVAVYSGDANFAGSSGVDTPAQVVHKAASGTTVTSSPNPSIYLQQVTITATVTGQGASGTVDFTDTFNHLVTHLCMGVHLSGGVARCMVSTLMAGTHDDIVAVYSGDANFAGSSGVDTPAQVVHKAASQTTVTSTPNPSTYLRPVTITATVTAGATGTVEFTDTFNNVVTPLCMDVRLSGRVAMCSTSALLAGRHSHIVAVYSGDLNFAGSSGTAPLQTVNQAASRTTVISSPNPSTYLQQVTIKATVTGQGASGTVDFTDTFNNVVTPLCTGAHLSGGVARCVTSALPAGTHNHIVAVYNGDQNFAGSSSTAPAQVVKKAAAGISLSFNPSPSVRGERVTLKANVSPSVSTGTVMFVDMATREALCEGTLHAGTAACSTTSIDGGSRSIQAKYSGDSNFASNNTSHKQLSVEDFSPSIKTSSGNIISSFNVVQGFSNLNQPSPVSIKLTVQSDTGYSGMLALSCHGLPTQPAQAPPACNFSPQSVSVQSNKTAASTFTVSLQGQKVKPEGLTPPGIYPITIAVAGTSNNPSHYRSTNNATINLVVQQKTSPSCGTDGGQPLLSVTGYQTVTATFGCDDPDGQGTTGVSVDWGDGGPPTQIPRLGDSVAQHTYPHSGVYPVAVQATDVVAQTASVAEPLSQPAAISMIPGASNSATVSVLSSVSTTVKLDCVSVSGTNTDGTVNNADPSSLGIGCQFSSPSLALTANTPTPMTITVKTEAGGTPMTRLGHRIRNAAMLSMVMPAVLLIGPLRVRKRQRRKLLRLLALPLIIMVLLPTVSCGGGGFTPLPSPITKTGFYSILVQGRDSNGVVQTSVIVPVVIGF